MGFPAGVRILIVDDVPAMRSIIRNMLEEAGLTEVTEAEDGEMAWQLIRQNCKATPFSMVIADWNMPGLTGAELLRAIRSFGPTRDLPFFMVTAEGSQSHLSEAMNSGVTDYFVKPFSSAELGGKIKAALDRVSGTR